MNEIVVFVDLYPQVYCLRFEPKRDVVEFHVYQAISDPFEDECYQLTDGDGVVNGFDEARIYANGRLFKRPVGDVMLGNSIMSYYVNLPKEDMNRSLISGIFKILEEHVVPKGEEILNGEYKQKEYVYAKGIKSL